MARPPPPPAIFSKVVSPVRLASLSASPTPLAVPSQPPPGPAGIIKWTPSISSAARTCTVLVINKDKTSKPALMLDDSLEPDENSNQAMR